MCQGVVHVLLHVPPRAIVGDLHQPSGRQHRLPTAEIQYNLCEQQRESGAVARQRHINEVYAVFGFLDFRYICGDKTMKLK